MKTGVALPHALIAVGLLVFGINGSYAASPSFTLSPPSVTLPGIAATPADILNPAIPPAVGPMPAPLIGIPAAALGLLPGDVVAGFSFGILPPFIGGAQVLFSLDGASAGTPFLPPPANAACEAAGGQALADVFVSEPFGGPPLVYPNVLALDGNGLADAPCGPPPSPGLGLTEVSPDDVASLEICPASFVYSGGVLTKPVYVTLAPGSPTLVALGAGSGDILIVPAPAGPPAVAIPAATYGLVPGPPGCGAPVCDQMDDIEKFISAGAVFSLAPGSPTLAACSLSPADVLVTAPVGCPSILVSAPGLGLLPGDNIDALAVNYETDADFVADGCDNCPSLANNDQLDTDGDGIGDVCDTCVGPNIDSDLDTYCDTADNCPAVANPSQSDTDNDLIGDDCDACPTDATNTCCPATPDACTGGFAKGTIIKNEAAGKEKLIVKLLKGPLVNQIDFGDPLEASGTEYKLCIYDDTPTLVGDLEVARAGDENCSGGASTCWTTIGAAPPAGKGYKYKDTDSASDGVSKILLKGGPTSTGKSKILLKGSGANLPAGVTALLTTTSSVTIQLRGDNAPAPGCWTGTLSTVKKQTADFFKAK